MALLLTTQKSAARIAAMGARKMPKPDMKLNKLDAEWMIFQGTMIQPAVTVVIMTPRRMLMYLGNKLIMSLEQEITFADKLVPICAMTQLKPTKKAPARPEGPCHMAARARGSQMYSP